MTGAIGTGKILAHIEGEREPCEVNTNLYYKDDSTSMLKLSGIEEGGFPAGSLLGFSILALLGLIVCIPIVKLVYCLVTCCPKKKARHNLHLEDPGTQAVSFRHRNNEILHFNQGHKDIPQFGCLRNRFGFHPSQVSHHSLTTRSRLHPSPYTPSKETGMRWTWLKVWQNLQYPWRML